MYYCPHNSFILDSEPWPRRLDVNPTLSWTLFTINRGVRSISWHERPTELRREMMLILTTALSYYVSPLARVGDVTRATRPLMQESSPSSALAKAGTTFEQALGALPEGEKYNAVLLSLLSKRGAGDTSAMDLVSEMTTKRLILSAESLKAILDSAVDGGSIDELLQSFLAARDNGACRTFGTPQIRLPNRPNEGSLAALAPIPTDDRAAEVGAAAGVGAGLGALLLLEVADVLDWTVGTTVDAPPLPFVFALVGAAWGYDRYVGEGAVSDLLGRGVSRLLGRDLQRECVHPP